MVPLVLDGAAVGMFYVNSFTPNSNTEHLLARAMALSERVTQALRNARLFQLEQQRAQNAEELARLRDDFVASVSHELRTPLTIIGQAEILESRWTVAEAIELGVAIPVITQALENRFRSRTAEPFSDKLLSALRFRFGGHAIKPAE